MSDTETPSPSSAGEKPVVNAAKAPVRPQLRTGPSNPNMNGPLYMQSGSNVVLVRRLKQKDLSTSARLSRWFIENQIGLSFNLLALALLAHIFIPKARTYTYKIFHLCYQSPETGKYGIGFDDAYFISMCIALFTGLRAAAMEYVLASIAKVQGITKRKLLTRFTEQAWLMVYYSFFWPMGVYIYCKSPYYLNMRELWTDWPNREVDGLMKFYILAQWAFWLQQMIVINIEERRKDHWQMLSHHIITSTLICSCYSYHHTRVGNFILVIMDIVDIFFPLAKCLKYLGYTFLCDIAFGLFLISWILFRHIAYFMVCWSIWAHTPEIMPTGCFKGSNSNLVGPIDPPAGWKYLIEPFYDPTGHVCYNAGIKYTFLTPLLLLQFITIFWFTLIVRVAIKVFTGNNAEDSRSDDEGAEDDEEDEFVYEEAEPLKEEVGVEGLDLKRWERMHGLKIQGNSSGVSLLNHFGLTLESHGACCVTRDAESRVERCDKVTQPPSHVSGIFRNRGASTSHVPLRKEGRQSN